MFFIYVLLGAFVALVIEAIPVIEQLFTIWIVLLVVVGVIRLIIWLTRDRS